MFHHNVLNFCLFKYLVSLTQCQIVTTSGAMRALTLLIQQITAIYRLLVIYF